MHSESGDSPTNLVVAVRRAHRHLQDDVEVRAAERVAAVGHLVLVQDLPVDAHLHVGEVDGGVHERRHAARHVPGDGAIVGNDAACFATSDQ